MASLIEVARELAYANPGRPSQPYLTRAVSTAYYAMFHALARDCADLLMGGGSRARGQGAWVQIFRAVDHGAARNACGLAAKSGFSSGIVRFAETFQTLQEERYRADYDPTVRYRREDVLGLINEADRAIRSLAGAPRPERRAFAVSVLLKRR
jgi:uncharacterized protein (UPF0332 family)